MTLKVTVDTESWAYKVPFRVSRGAESSLEVVVVTLRDGRGLRGRGEAAGVDYDGETAVSLREGIESVRSELERGADRERLARLLPAGGARNAVDSALWDLGAKQRGVRVWELAGLPAPLGLHTAVTLGIDTDEAVIAGACRYADWPMIKVKVDGERHIGVVRRVHEEAPHARIIVDPNQAWDRPLLDRLAPELATLGVVLIEQPVPRGEDETLRGYAGPVPLAADESVSDRGDLSAVKELYRVVNVKLDKTGGLTEALALAREVRGLGLGLMVGCMAGTSLAMAPGMVVAQMAAFVDLDGPLLHAQDRPFGIQYDSGRMALPSPELWG